jgi:osmotically-inducible protein OsmY
MAGRLSGATFVCADPNDPNDSRNIMKRDSAVRRDVERELEWEPSIDERRIGVSAVDGIVTLTGEVSTYAEKWKAERTVERVAGSAASSTS